MIIGTSSVNQSQSIRDKNILSIMIINISKNTLILTLSKIGNALDEMMYLCRYRCTCKSTCVPIEVQIVLVAAHRVLLSLFLCTSKSTEVYSISR
jgi:hypothetical protein